jgi:lauroyl/myristoyl acyltransferase
LALKHNLPITILGGCRRPDGRYHVWATEAIHMQRRKDLVEETLTNTEAVLSAVANVIRRAPEQWAMFYPVWPEVLNQPIP